MILKYFVYSGLEGYFGIENQRKSGDTENRKWEVQATVKVSIGICEKGND